LAGNGSGRATTATGTPCTPADKESGVFASRKHPADFTAKILKRRIQYAAPGIEDNRPGSGHNVVLGTDGFSHAALQTVTQHGFAQGARNCEAEMRRIGSISGPQTKRNKITAGHPDTRLIDLAEVG